jgi:hypothetical protein
MIGCRKCESRFDPWTVAQLKETGFSIAPGIQKGFDALGVEDTEKQTELCPDCLLAHFGIPHELEDCLTCTKFHVGGGIGWLDKDHEPVAWCAEFNKELVRQLRKE